MKARPLFFLTLAFSLCLLTAAQATHKLQKVKIAPQGVSKKIADLLDSTGFQVTGPKGVVCEIWLLKNLSVVPGFKPTLNVKYPFTNGQLIGVLRVPKKITVHRFSRSGSRLRCLHASLRQTTGRREPHRHQRSLRFFAGTSGEI